jgi:hypothetical protein
MATAKKKAAKAATPTRKAAPAKRATAKPAANSTARAAPKAAAAEAAKAPKPEKPKKPKKPKLVRDSFTIPKAEYAVLDQLKRRAAQSGTPAKKSELLRAGLKALAGMEDAAFVAALGAVPALKTGRPAKN